MVVKRTLLLLGVLASFHGYAEPVIDQDAITSESVYPRFEKSDVVLNRIVPVAGRTQVALFGGLRRNDPYFKSYGFAGAVTYHFTEMHTAQLYLASFSNSASQESKALNDQTGVKNLHLAPSPDTLWLLNYKIIPYYGKVSFTKTAVFNLGLYGDVGLGQIIYSGKPFTVTSVGVGDDLYFSENWGMSLDIRGLFFNGPDATSKNLSAATSKPSVSVFDTSPIFNLLLQIGVVRLF